MKVYALIEVALRKTGRGARRHETVKGIIGTDDALSMNESPKTLPTGTDVKVVRWIEARPLEVFDTASDYRQSETKRRTANAAAAVISKLTAEQIAALTAAGILSMPDSIDDDDNAEPIALLTDDDAADDEDIEG